MRDGIIAFPRLTIVHLTFRGEGARCAVYHPGFLVAHYLKQVPGLAPAAPCHARLQTIPHPNLNPQNMKNSPLILAALAVCHSTALAAPISITAGSLSYTQDFNSLGTASVPWTNDSTIPGWYAQIFNGTTATGSAQAADGAAVLSGLLNLGTAAAADRALGSKATGTGNIANIAYAVSFQNNGTKPVAFTGLQYTGELWRTNTGTGAPLVAVDEEYAVFYQVSATAVINILSGTSNATAAAGAGFTALGAGANWVNPLNSPLGTALDGNAPANRTTVTFSPSGVTVPPGQFLMIKWTDANEGGTDGFQGIDDVIATFVELDGALTPSFSSATRLDPLNTPADPTDDTFGFTASVAGSGTGLSASWATASVNPPAGNANTAAYGASVIWTGFPVSGPKTVSFTDAANAIYTAALTVQVPRLIGDNNLVAPVGLVTTNGTTFTNWVVNETLRTLTQNNATQVDHVVDSAPINLSAIGNVQVSATLDAITGASSGFEALDAFGLQLIIDGAAPVSILGASDVDSNGRLNGAAAAGGPELPDTTLVSTTKTFNFTGFVPASANSLVIRIIGNSNSASETFVVKNIVLSNPPPTLQAVVSGPVVLNNQGTPAAGDDTLTAPVTITPINLGASTGWTSNALPASGLYSAANPVSFGPLSAAASPVSIILTDTGNPAATSAFTITAPVPVITLSTASNIVRHENGPGLADDTVSFDVTVTGTNGGPTWTASGAAAGTGAFGLANVTVSVATSPAVVIFSDTSYPTVTQNVSVAIPTRYTIGWQYDGVTLTDVFSDVAAVPAPEWVNDPALHTLNMSAGGTTDKIVASDVLNLSGTGTVHFSALLRARETSTGTNFETTDRFKAELLIDGGLVPANVIKLVSAWDSGDGASATAVATSGLNGPANDYINGYQGTAALDLISNIDYAVAPLVAEDEYNANKVRDEFNTRAGGQIADTPINNTFALSAIVPAGANSVQLRIYGANDAGSEFFTVSQVVFSTVAPTADTDGDGVPDLTELVDGTNPLDPASVFTVTTLTSGPGGAQVVGFPTVAGRVYRGYFSTDLAIWTRDDSVPLVTGNGTVQSWTLPVLAAPAGRHYLKVLTGFSATDFPATLP